MFLFQNKINGSAWVKQLQLLRFNSLAGFRFVFQYSYRQSVFFCFVVCVVFFYDIFINFFTRENYKKEKKNKVVPCLIKNIEYCFVSLFSCVVKPINTTFLLWKIIKACYLHILFFVILFHHSNCFRKKKRLKVLRPSKDVCFKIIIQVYLSNICNIC